MFEYSQGPLGDILRTSWGRFESTSQGRPFNVRLRRPQDVRLGRPRDGQLGSLGDVGGGPIFAGWVFCDFFVLLLQFKDSNGPNIHWSNLLWIFPTNIYFRGGFRQIGFLQIDFFFFPIAQLIFCSESLFTKNPFELIFPSLPLQYCSNLFCIFSAKVFAYQRQYSKA